MKTVEDNGPNSLNEIATLFPSHIWKFNPVWLTDNLEQINQTVDELCASKAQLRNFRISEDTSIHTREEFSQFADTIFECAKKVLDWNQTEYKDFYIAEMWANQSGPGYRHPIHTHANSLLSGIAYLKLPEGSSPTLFYDPRPGFRQLEPMYKDYGPHNSGVCGMAVEPGEVIFFPSALPHGVELGFWDPELDEDGNCTNWRTTINFTIMIKSEIGIPTAKLTLS